MKKKITLKEIIIVLILGYITSFLFFTLLTIIIKPKDSYKGLYPPPQGLEPPYR